MYARLDALKACLDQGMLRVLIESDFSVLVSAMKKPRYEYSPAGVLIEEAKSFIMLNFVNVEFLFSLRSCNACVHELARVGFTRDPDRSGLWFDPLPKPVMPLLTRDLAGSVVDE
jgi:hypothetical protein